MVRQYKIHTDLTSENDKVWDMTDGIIRFYQPSDFGLINITNVWQSQGVGIIGNSSISHPELSFKLETFGDSLEDNYRIFNSFINDILSQKYVTLEYTNELGTYFGDIELSKVSKTEAYGFNGTFSEEIAFNPINLWYTFEDLKFSNIDSAQGTRNQKIHANSQLSLKKFRGANISAFVDLSIDDIVSQSKRINVNTLTVPFRVVVDNATSDTMSFGSDYDRQLNKVSELTKRGYNVIIEPYPYIADGSIPETQWIPSNTDNFFTNWQAICDRIGAIAQKYNGKYYIASNLVNVESYSDKWVSLINALKAKYTAPMIYRTNYWVTASWAPDTITAYQNKLNNPLFGLVDEIAIAGYFELTDKDVPTVDELKQAILNVPIYNRGQNIFSEIKAFNDKWKKKIFFGELGIAPYKGASATPWKYDYPSSDYNETVQANWYQAWYETFQDYDWFNGFSIFLLGSENLFTITPLGEKTLNTLNSRRNPNVVYPNLNLLDGTSSIFKNATILSGQSSFVLYGDLGKFKSNTVTISAFLDLTNSSYDAKIQLWTNSGVIAGSVVKAGQTGYSIGYGIIPSSFTASNIAIRTENVSISTTIPYFGLKMELGSTATPWVPSKSEASSNDFDNLNDLYTYNYVYVQEDNIERFAKWKISQDIFSIEAKLIPNKRATTFGIRFLDEQFNEYSAIIFNNSSNATPESVILNTDYNNEYYQSKVQGTNVFVNAFSNIDFSRYRTRQFKTGSMEIVGLAKIEINVKRKVDFV
ncbi:hypothetical protein GHI93_12010 [Lactococcus hircilactis]|uniref:Uncharacterized protein n=1 Tax=Lactococcus hircilactis TaxID=1494462 RepID=A0A7X1ZB47_9LACT|nr:phage distal tail protein domain-containing protein [Lactococcus hircilactis]MQW40639.1 hypothetical protein [Lactococcus hircilactis]